MMADTVLTVRSPSQETSRVPWILRLLWRDKFAFAGAVFLLVVLFAAIFGPALLGKQAVTMNLLARNAPPLSLDKGWLFVLGGDPLGRSLLARLVVGTQNTMAIAALTVTMALTVGCLFGLLAGYVGGIFSAIIMRISDILMSFPSLLLALIVLYVLQPHLATVVFVLAITRVPLYLRTIRAEVLEVRERVFVTAARVLGTSPLRIVFRHILPVVAPTLITIATLDVAFVMLSESGLSFLGLGMQAPDITWGLMIASGQNYLKTAWWLSFWPGLAITLTTMSLNLVANWLRIVADPAQRWRLETKGMAND